MLISRVFILSIITCTLFMLKPDSSKAQANPEGGNNFGIGVIIGEPTGLSVKSWNADKTAFNIGAAWSLTEREALHLHADFLLHSWFDDVDTGRLAFYYGIGGRIIFADDTQVGVRVPLGLNYILPKVPFDLFAEVAPILDLTPTLEFAGNGGAGIRYYFN